MTTDQRPTANHLRLVSVAPSVAASPILPAATASEPSCHPARGVGPYEHALATLAVAVTTGARAQYDRPLRILQYCGYSRYQLQEILTLVVHTAGPQAQGPAADVLERYDALSDSSIK